MHLYFTSLFFQFVPVIVFVAHNPTSNHKHEIPPAKVLTLI